MSLPSPHEFEFYRLEERVLLSGDAPEANAEIAADVELIEQLLEQATADGETVLSSSNTPASPLAQETRIEVVFVDASVEDAQTLIDGLIDSQEADIEWLVFELDGEQDGIEQISATLEELTGVDAIHLVSHGDGDGIQLGKTTLDNQSAAGYAGALASWSQALDEDADLLVYGCDLASTEAGRDLIEMLSAVCDCDVAASDDLTGHESLGGDWILEFQVGEINTDAAFSIAAQASWYELLNVTSYTSPTATGEDHNDFTNPEGAFASDDDRASETTGGDAQDYYGFDFGAIPEGSAINGFQFSVEGYRESFAGLPYIQLSWDGGATYTSADEIIPLAQNSDSTNTVGSSTNIWGRQWTAAELSSENFRVRITKPAGGADFSIDHLQARVHWSAPITVTTTNDVLDGDTSSVSNLLANQGADGFISLREAIIAANNTSGNEAILLGSGTYDLTITGDAEQLAAQGDLDVSSTILITGAGTGSTTINGSMSDRIFDVLSGGDLRLDSLSVTGGDGDFYTGGAAFVDGTFTANDVVFRNNETANANGAAIFTQGTTTLDRVAIVDNVSTANGTGLTVAGGTTTLSNVTISGNTSTFDGAGIAVTGGSIDISHSTIANNNATSGNGGGLYVNGGTANVSYSIFADNTSSFGGNDVHGAITSGGYNIIEHNNGFTGSTGTDIVGSDPGLSGLTLADDSYVHVFAESSIAFDAAIGSTLTLDQRGVTRDANPDIGAYEHDGAPYAIEATASTGGGLSINADGGNDVYLQADTSPFSGQSAVTIEVEFSLDSPATGMTTLFSYTDPTNQDELFVGIDTDGEVHFRTSENGGTGYGSITNASQLLDGNKHTVSVTWENATGILMFYVDGQPLGLGRNSYQTGTTIDAGGTVVIGQHQSIPGSGFVAGDTFSGTIHGVRVFDEVRTAEEISASYQTELPHDESGCSLSGDWMNCQATA